MKNLLKKIAWLIAAGVLISSCNEKKAAPDEKVFSLEGCEIRNDSYGAASLYDENSNEIAVLGAGTTMKIIDDGAVFGMFHVNVPSLKKQGWVYKYTVDLNSQIYLRALKPALNGDKNARDYFDYNYADLSFEEAMDALKTIVDFVGAGRFKKISPNNEDDRFYFETMKPIFKPYLEVKNYTTRQIHILADCANEETLEWAYSSLYEQYTEREYDSDGRSCMMRAVEAGNIDALHYYCRFMPLNGAAMETKDLKGKSLNDYIAETKNEKIKKLVDSYRIEVPGKIKEAASYLRGVQAESEEKYAEKADTVTWLNQNIVTEGNSYTVIKKSELIVPGGKNVSLEPFEKVEIIKKITGDDDEVFWDYGGQDPEYRREYMFRCNYFLVRTEKFDVGILGGSSIAHAKMYKNYEGPSFVEKVQTDLEFYYTVFIDPERSERFHYAKLYEANPQSNKIYALRSGISYGVPFQEEPLCIGMTEHWSSAELTLTGFREYKMDVFDYADEGWENGSFYSIIIRSPTVDDMVNVAYHYYTVGQTVYEHDGQETKTAYNGLRLTGYEKTEKSFYCGIYTYFDSENGSTPKVVFGVFGNFPGDWDGSGPYHSATHYEIRPEDFTFTEYKKEDYDFLPEW